MLKIGNSSLFTVLDYSIVPGPGTGTWYCEKVYFGFRKYTFSSQSKQKYTFLAVYPTCTLCTFPNVRIPIPGIPGGRAIQLWYVCTCTSFKTTSY